MSWLDRFVYPENFRRWRDAHSAFEDYQNSEDVADLNRSITKYSEIIESDFYGIIFKDRASICNGLGNALRLRFYISGEVSDLETAILVLRDMAVPYAETQDLERSDILANLAEAFRDRYQLYGNISDIRDAESNAQAALSIRGLSSKTRSEQLMALGAILETKFETTGDFSDLDAAESAFESALVESECDKLVIWTNLAGVHFRRFQRTWFRADIDKAVILNRQALEALRADRHTKALHSANLANVLIARGEYFKRQEDIEESAQLLRYSLDNYGPNPFAANIWNSIGVVQHLIYEWSGARESLDDAIASKLRAVELSGGVDNCPAVYLISYARSLQKRAGEDDEEAREVERIYRKCATDVGGHNPVQAVEAAVKWQNWANGRREWSQVIEAYRLGSAGIRRLMNLRDVRIHKEDWLGSAVGTTVQCAYAYGMTGRNQEAVHVLEEGRAVLLQESLANKRTSRNADVVSLQALPKEDDVNSTGAQGSAKKLPSSHTAVMDAQLGAITYLISVAAGGGAFIDYGSTVDFVSLPELSFASVSDRVSRYAKLYDLAVNAGASRVWRREIDTITAWLWDAAMGPVVARLRDGLQGVPVPVMSLIPTGILGLLPFHAAWTQVAGSEVKRRYLFDLFKIRVLLSRKISRNRRLAPDSAVVVCGPGLDDTQCDIDSVGSAIGKVTVLGPEDPVDAIFDENNRADVLHLACHGTSNADYNLSRIAVSDVGALSVGDIISSDLSPRLVFLAACESGHYGLRLPEEVLGFPAAFLEAGAAGVIASLWRVPSTATCDVSRCFYRYWKATGFDDPAEALRLAQIELRDNAEKEFFASPFWWGGFQLFGF